MSDTTTPGAELLIDYRLSQLERAVTKLVEQNATIIAMEQRHLETREALERAFKSLKEQDGRIRAIETDLPTMRLVRGWVITGVLAVMAASGTVVVKSVTTMPPALATQPSRTG